MQRDKTYILDILEAARLAVTYVGEKTKEEFLNDLQCQDAVIRRLEIIGEAARRISEKTKSAYQNLPWYEMVGMRNVMIHDYDDVDMVIVWETVQNDLPPLMSALENILPPESAP
jgi:uncharacterized protein with HEPN domain